ncbi:MAG TPA: galactokinase [Candidatus Acidoferrales bacterium]|nr:galactokinase [Candidatus Acidoferrales bacterium]
MISVDDLRRKFAALFGGTPHVFRAPGRVNLIGEHVDYNEGWVLPLAIDRSCFVAARKRNDAVFRIHSEQMKETMKCSFNDPRPSQHHWSNYIRGVAWALREAGASVFGADMYISTEIPLGAGLSSSAALEVAAGFSLLRLSGLDMDRVALARVCQRAENEYVRMRCGIMDQLTACCGRRGNALLIDCRTLEIEHEPMAEDQVSVVVANTMVQHALAATSEYNRRRQECDEAVARLRQFLPGVKSLRDAIWREMEPLTSKWPENIRRRARHVATEIARVHAAAAALRRNDFEEFGELLTQSHASLVEDFEVSSAELNLMVALARGLPGFLGARMTGAGFGGCTVNLVWAGDAAQFVAKLTASYEAQTRIRPDVHICHASDGVEEMN